MELNPIGKHCALPSCNVLDFLPIQCSCLEWFCKLHISPELHDCALVQHSLSESNSSSTSVRSICTFAGCDKPSLVTGATSGDLPGVVQNGCPGCHLSFCVHHRHMQSHSCAGLTVENDDTKHEAARAILSQKILAPDTSTSRTPIVVRQRRNLPQDSKSLAQLQKINLMKLRNKAIPADPKDGRSLVPVDQRLHVTTRLEIIGQPAKELALWFRKTTVGGKALDLIVQHFGIPGTTSTHYIQQSFGDVRGRVLQNHLELSAQLEDGSTVILSNSFSEG